MESTSATLVLLVISTAAFFGGCLGAPGQPVNQSEALSYMRKYGYIGGGGVMGTAQLLVQRFSEQTFAEAIKQVQKFGGLEQTGLLDEGTLQLMASRRCGVADFVDKPVDLGSVSESDSDESDISDTSETEESGELDHHHHHHHHYHNHHDHSRRKRYILASRGWNKRHLTYYLANWPEGHEKQEVMGVIKSALGIWAKYGQLKFRETSDHSKADIIFGFYRGHHGDQYPFDGEGKVLAHAFFPGPGGSYEGDVHFDSDEKWTVNMKPGDRGVDLFTVALHELGHSMGLSHSPESGSVMYPFYRSSYKDLGYDDMLAMHKLYVERHLDDDGVSYDEEDEEEETTPKQRPPHRPPHHPPHHPPHRPPHHPPHHPPHRHPLTTTTTTTPKYDGATAERKNGQGTWYEPKPLDGCKGNFDTVAYIRGELFIIKNKMLWRLRGPGQVLPNYPAEFRRLFKLPDRVKTIDAMYERETDSSIIIFAGKEFWVYNGYEFIDSPRPLTDYGLPWSTTKVDGVTARNGTTYIFRNEKYWMYDDKTKSLLEDSPRLIKKTFGFPTTIDSVMTYNDGKMYLFKGNHYWIFTDRLIIPRPVPSTASGYWLGC